jgi:hypothetical protein
VVNLTTAGSNPVLTANSLTNIKPTKQMANQTININLDRKSVIERLLDKRKGFEYDYLDALKVESAHKTAMAEYYREVMTAVLDGLEHGKGEINDVGVYYDRTSICVDFTVDAKKPARLTQTHSSRHYQDRIDEIDQTISLLEMCTDDTIKSKQYGNIIGLIF